jgi:hypothetical protein
MEPHRKKCRPVIDQKMKKRHLSISSTQESHHLRRHPSIVADPNLAFKKKKKV